VDHCGCIWVALLRGMAVLDIVFVNGKKYTVKQLQCTFGISKVAVDSVYAYKHLIGIRLLQFAALGSVYQRQ
jgi:hypothetical protein